LEYLADEDDHVVKLSLYPKVILGSVSYQRMHQEAIKVTMWRTTAQGEVMGKGKGSEMSDRRVYIEKFEKLLK
jgi:hypothetical protein